MNSTQTAKLESFQELAEQAIRQYEGYGTLSAKNELRGWRLTWTKALVMKYRCDKADINAAWNRAVANSRKEAN